MAALRLTALAAVLATALAGCPSGCSGHGSCTRNDICECFANWHGADCSMRTCAYGNSWAIDAKNPHEPEECSGAGMCDRSTGECKCFAGFAGFACQRRTCPNECSGHGVCRYLSELETPIPYDDFSWEADHIQACVCDPGFFGSDCSQRRCATGDDPLTLCRSTTNGQWQEVKLTLGSKVDYANPWSATDSYFDDPTTTYGEGMDLFGTYTDSNGDFTSFYDLRSQETSAQLRVGYTDAYGQVYSPPSAVKAALNLPDAITDLDIAADTMEISLENVGSNKVKDVKVLSGYVTDQVNIISKRFLVSFVPDVKNSNNFGNQNALSCESGYGCINAGCQPRVRMPFLYRYATFGSSAGDLGLLEKADVDANPDATGQFYFYTGFANDDNDFAAKKFVRLHEDSQPRMPLGVAIDNDFTSTDLSRYDIRIAVVVQDPSDATNSDSDPDVYWTKVTYTHTNISTDVAEYDSSAAVSGVWSNTDKATAFQGTLLGFSFRGYIPANKKASLQEAPGVILEFPDTNMVAAETNYRFFEILVKLPRCDVTPLVKGDEFLALDGTALAPVDVNVENIECSNRGQCNRDSGMCECFEGYTGVACNTQSVLV